MHEFSNAAELRALVNNSLSTLQERLNEVMSGRNLDSIRDTIVRLDQSNGEPGWFKLIEQDGRIANPDGKSVGTVIEKLATSVIEVHILAGRYALSVNPARGVDIPQLGLGIKSPSTNFCTSEPFFSAYERLLGNQFDAIVLLTNYQKKKGGRDKGSTDDSFSLQISQVKYLRGSEIADCSLCRIARRLRDCNAFDEPNMNRIYRFLAYINQSDWVAKVCRSLLSVLPEESRVYELLPQIERAFHEYNSSHEEDFKLPRDVLSKFLALQKSSNVSTDVIRLADDWVIETQKDFGRFPNDNELSRLASSPLDGKIGMSFALQWRYNFSSVFPGARRGNVLSRTNPEPSLF